MLLFLSFFHPFALSLILPQPAFPLLPPLHSTAQVPILACPWQVLWPVHTDCSIRHPSLVPDKLSAPLCTKFSAQYRTLDGVPEQPMTKNVQFMDMTMQDPAPIMNDLTG